MLERDSILSSFPVIYKPKCNERSGGIYIEYRNNVRLSQVNAKSYLNLFRLIFYEVKTSLRSRDGTRKNGRQNISIMLLLIYSINHMTTKHRS